MVSALGAVDHAMPRWLATSEPVPNKFNSLCFFSVMYVFTTACVLAWVFLFSPNPTCLLCVVRACRQRSVGVDYSFIHSFVDLELIEYG